MKKASIILVIGLILFFACLIRVMNTDKTIVFDEYTLMKTVVDYNSVGLTEIEIPPVATWSMIFFTKIFGLNVWAVKLCSVIFGLLSILLVYLLGKEIYDTKTGLIAAVIMAISAWHVLVTTSISYDGAYLTFFYMLSVFTFIKYYHTNKIIWLVSTGLSFGLAMLTKLNAILIIPILILYAISEIKDLRDFNEFQKIFLDFSIIGVISILFFAVYPILAYFSGCWPCFMAIFKHTAQLNVTENFQILLLFFQYVLASIWMGPMLIGFYILKIFNFEKKDILSHIWIIIIICFFTFIVGDNFRPVERYFLVLFPPICILGGNYISQFKFNKKDIILYVSAFFIFLTVLFAINMSQNETLPFYPKTELINHVINFDWNFLVPFTGDQGPIGMYLSFNSIAVSFIASGIFLILLLVCRKRMLAKTIFLVFLAVSTAFNAVMLEEMVFSTTQVNVDKVTKETVQYALNNDLQTPLFVFRNYAIKYYLSPKYGNITQIDFKDEYNHQMIKSIQEGGTVLVIDFPKMNRESDLWNALTACKKIKDFEDKNQTAAFIFGC